MSNLIIKVEAFQKLFWLVDRAGSSEVSGLGRILLEGNKLVLSDIYLIGQSNSVGGSHLKPEALSQFLLEIDDPENIRFWWHSHAGMAVFWSPTDTDTIQLFGAADWFVSLVTNLEHQTLIQMEIQYPFPHSIDLNLKVQCPSIQGETLHQLETEYNEKIDVLAPVVVGYGYGRGDGRYRDQSLLPDAPQGKFQLRLEEKYRKGVKIRNKEFYKCYLSDSTCQRCPMELWQRCNEARAIPIPRATRREDSQVPDDSTTIEGEAIGHFPEDDGFLID